MTNVTERIVATQEELDQALSDPDVDRIMIDSESDVWLQVTSNGVSTVRGASLIVARESSSVVARESASVAAWDSSSVVARDTAHVVAWDTARVLVWDRATVDAAPGVIVRHYTTRETVNEGKHHESSYPE